MPQWLDKKEKKKVHLQMISDADLLCYCVIMISRYYAIKWNLYFHCHMCRVVVWIHLVNTICIKITPTGSRTRNF